MSSQVSAWDFLSDGVWCGSVDPIKPFFFFLKVLCKATTGRVGQYEWAPTAVPYHHPTESFPKRTNRSYISLKSMSVCLCSCLEIYYKELEHIILEARNPKSRSAGLRGPWYHSSTKAVCWGIFSSFNWLTRPTHVTEDSLLFLRLHLWWFERDVPHSLGLLNTRSSVGDTVWGSLGGLPLLEEVMSLEAGFENLKTAGLLGLLFKMWVLSLLLQPPCLLTAMILCHGGDRLLSLCHFKPK